jgi:hypothetical protein
MMKENKAVFKTVGNTVLYWKNCFQSRKEMSGKNPKTTGIIVTPPLLCYDTLS